MGEANAVRAASLEHKLGVHGSPTCVMLYEDAKAELVGAPNQGLAAMFVMMNSARLQVGVQGVGLAERAYQAALAYALDRKQGRSAWTGALPSRLFDHPDIRRTLMLMKARIEAARGLCLATAVQADLARLSVNPLDRETAKMREDLLTPPRQGLVDRHGRRDRLRGPADPRRHGLHRGDRRRPALPRRAHPADLRGRPMASRRST